MTDKWRKVLIFKDNEWLPSQFGDIKKGCEFKLFEGEKLLGRYIARGNAKSEHNVGCPGNMIVDCETCK